MSLHYVTSLDTTNPSPFSSSSSSSSPPPIEIKAINRNPSDFTRTRSNDIYKQFHNPSSLIHKHEKGREYIRALNATKLERIFAKPFVYAYDDHHDSITSLALSSTSLTHLTSASADGSLIYYDLQQRKPIFNIYNAHNGMIKGCVMSRSADQEYILSCGQDQSIKMYNIDECITTKQHQHTTSPSSVEAQLTPSSLTITPSRTWLGQTSYNSIDTPRIHSRQRYDHDNQDDNNHTSVSYESNSLFVTAGNQVDIWNIERSEPIHSYSWGCDTVNSVKFNSIEPNIIASTASDRNIVIYDLRTHLAVRKIVMKMLTNSICWDPHETYVFATANEDTNVYTFDFRKLDHATQIYQDHVSAVMSLDYSPTGKELVTGGYDKTIRMFNTSTGHSRDVYHTKRMQRIFTVKYSYDHKYIYSGSDDGSVRIWKAHASEKLTGVISPREREKIHYYKNLQEKYKYVPEIQRISRHRHLPKSIYKARQLKHIAVESSTRKEMRRRQHNKAESEKPYISAKQRTVLREEK